MSLFHNILEQISKKLKDSELNKDQIAEDISKIINTEIKSDQITIKNEKIFISVSPTIRTVVYLKKVKILEVLCKYKITTIA